MIPAPFRRFVLALQFLTVVTVWPGLKVQGRDLAGSVPFFPLVGLFLGAGLALFRYLVSDVFPPILGDALTIALWVALTRGLHLEGVADSSDALAHGIHRDRALEIMKDSRSGAFAIMGVALVLLLKWAGLMSLSPNLKITALIIMPVAARWAMVLIMAISQPARSDGGLGRSFIVDIGFLEALIAGISAFAFGILLMGAVGAFIMAGAAVYAWLASLYLKRRLGGVTGDVIGATGETTEVLTLLALAALLV